MTVTAVLNWLQSAPPNAIPLATAVLAALVALLVAALTQWIVGRRARTELLRKKLEDLYLILLDWMDDAVAAKIAADELVKDQPLTSEQRSRLLEHYSKPRADRRISMHIGFYFQEFEGFSDEIFKANRDFARVIRLMGQGKQTTAVEIQRAWLRLMVALAPFRKEIFENRTYLTHGKLFRGRYRNTRGATTSNLSLHPTYYGWLRQPPSAGELKR